MTPEDDAFLEAKFGPLKGLVLAAAVKALEELAKEIGEE